MAAVHQMRNRGRIVLLKGVSSGRYEGGVVLAPYRKQGGLPFSQVFLKSRIKLHICPVVKNQVGLFSA